MTYECGQVSEIMSPILILRTYCLILLFARELGLIQMIRVQSDGQMIRVQSDGTESIPVLN